MNREETKKVLNAIDFKDGDNIVIINKNVYDKMKNEKQQLISWLEDKIKECMDKKEAFIEGLDNLDLEIDIMKVLNQRKVYQEVLDFINKGGKRMKKIFNNKKFIVTVGTILSFILGFIASIFIYRWLINFIIG